MAQRKRRNVLVYAVVLGMIAAAAAAWYVVRAEAAANPTESVVIAKTYIPARTVLTEDMLVIKKAPKGAVHPESSNTMEPFIGKTTKQSIAGKEQVLASKLFKSRAQSGLAFVLPQGHRAVAINVNERIAAGGLVVPGDKVDVIASCLVDVQDKNTKISRVVYSLQDMEVLAVAQDVEGEEAEAPVDAVRAQNPQSSLSQTRRPQATPMAKTITLSLAPDEAQKLVLLENHPSCGLRLALRATGDNGRIGTGVVDFDPALSMTPILSR